MTTTTTGTTMMAGAMQATGTDIAMATTEMDAHESPRNQNHVIISSLLVKSFSEPRHQFESERMKRPQQFQSNLEDSMGFPRRPAEEF